MGPIVSLRLEDATILEILVAIGRQSPGVVWIAGKEPRTGRVVLKAITQAGVLSPIGALSN